MQASQSHRGFLAVAREWSTPRGDPGRHAIEVVVGPEAAPKLRDFVVMQAEEGDTDGAAGEAAEDDLLWVAAELGADSGDVRLRIAHGGVDVAPPGNFVLLVVLGDVRQDDPDGLAAGNAVSETRAFDLAGRAGGWVVVAGVFGDDGPVLAASLPVRRPVVWSGDQVMHLGAGIFRWRHRGTLARLRALFCQRRKREVSGTERRRHGQKEQGEAHSGFS